MPQKYDPKSYIAPTRKDWEEKAAVGDVRAITELATDTICYKKQVDINDILWVKKSADLGARESALWLASLYLSENYLNKDSLATCPDSLMLYRQVVSPNDAEAMHWLKKAAAPPQAIPSATCELAKAYYQGNKLKKSLKEAYLWYVEANPRFNECAIKGLREMDDKGHLVKFNPELSSALKKNDPLILYNAYVKTMQNTERPKDVKLALKEQFKISSDAPQPVYSVEETYYQLYVFADGKVQYRSNRSYITGKDEWQIPKEKVKQFLTALEKTNIYYGRNEVEPVACDMGESWRYGKIFTIKNKQPYLVEYSTVRHSFTNPITAKIFQVQETYIPTQHLRCGNPREDNDYKNCVASDKYSFESADRANNTLK